MIQEKKFKVSHFAAWNVVPECLEENFMAELAAAGAERITTMSRQLVSMMENKEYLENYKKILKKLSLVTKDAHGLAGPRYDLDIPEEHERIIEDHKKALDICGELGIETYTVHVGAAPWCRRPGHIGFDVLRPLALDTLEKILPHAEKNNCILAVENSFEPVNAPGELLYYINYFSSPYVKCCYDSGHANIMGKYFYHADGSRTEKDPVKYKPTFHEIVWFEGLKLEEDTLGLLAPHVVTCHLHDNDGYGDNHTLPGCPGRGTINWKRILKQLFACPNLKSIQNESNFATNHVIAREVVRIFDYIERGEDPVW